mgnify:CR=1 FL=1
MPAREALRRYDDQATSGQVAYYLPASDAGGLDQVVEDYKRLRSDNSKARHCRGLAHELQRIGHVPAGLAARRDAAEEYRRYLDLRVEAEAEQPS